MNLKKHCSSKIDRLNVEKPTDEAIFAAFKQGNIAALETLYNRYGLLVYRLVYRMLNNSQEAEDLTQEIFLSLQERPKYNPYRGSFHNYLMMLARSRTIDKLRLKRSQKRFFRDLGKMKDIIGKPNPVSPIEKISMDERAIQVKNALQHLSTNQRQVLELSYYQGLSQSEIAERLNLLLGTVKTHSRRGLLQLRKKLKGIVNYND